MSDHIQEIKKSISFIFITNNVGSLLPNGTGFFMGVRNETDNNIFNVYFVTAKHVLQDEQGNYFPEITLRLNTLNGDSQLIKIDLTKTKIFTHSDKDVDIAVFNCLPDQKTFDFRFIQNDLIATKELIKTHEIREGDEVFFTGLFTAHIGQKRNQPIVRFGKVSLMPEEKIEWKEKDKVKLMDLYLLECQSFGGNSGSPVFFQLGQMRKPGTITFGVTFFFAGIMTGSFLQGNKVQITNVVSNLISLQNLGIAAVTPAYKLHEVLFSEEVVKSRKIVKD